MARRAVSSRERDQKPVPGKKKSSGTAGAAAGYLFACLLLVFSLLGRAELTAMTQSIEARTEEIRELEEENARLQIARSEAMDLEEAERYATQVLGMCTPRPGLTGQSGAVLPDRVTVLSREGAQRLARALEAVAGRLGECFS